MKSLRPDSLLTAQDRIGWVIDRAKQTGMTPERLAVKCGITRPALLHWRKPTTDVDSIGVGPLMAFCQATGVALHWVLTGQGDPDQPAAQPAEITELGRDLARLAREEPAEYRVLVRMIRGATKDE